MFGLWTRDCDWNEEKCEVVEEEDEQHDEPQGRGMDDIRGEGFYVSLDHLLRMT